MALFNFTPLHLPIKFDSKLLEKFYRQIITSVPRIATYEVSVDVPNILAGATATVSITVQGITTEDIILVNQPDLGGIALVTYRVTATNSVDLFFWNPTGVDINPSKAVFKIVSIRR